MRFRIILAGLVLATGVAGYVIAQDENEGGSVGKIVTVGEDRIVVAIRDQGQMTFEVQSVQDGDEWIKDRGQMAQIQTLKQDQMVHVMWRKGDGGHYFIKELFAGPEDGARQGLVQGSVIVADEGRIVLAKDGGGQITLEPNWVRRQGEWGRNIYHDLFGQGLEPGDHVVAMWQLDVGPHFVIRGIAQTDPERQALAVTLLQAELRESHDMIRELQDQVGSLSEQIRKLSEQIEAREQ